MKVSVGEFLQRLEDSEILGESALETVRGKAGEADTDAEPFVKRLHKDGDLTGYQAQALWKGKGQKLSFGNYVVEDELGRGGMGVVLRARHRRMKRLVAVKVLPAKFTEDADAIARFQREVEAAAQLSHANIVAAHDADEIDGQQILVMEFVDGRDLASIVKKRGRLSVEQSLDCVIQAARGLEYAHGRGVIHRDIKPANLLLDSEGTVKILDMGLARFSDAADVDTQAALTGTGTIMGTVDYMSPEQAMSTRSADARADQYSLGITLYFLLTGQPAYRGETLMARLMAHANEPIPDLRAGRPDVSEDLPAVFARMVAKQPDDRYGSMTEVIAALESCRGGGSGTALVASAPRTAEDSSGGLTGFLQSLDTGDISDSISASRANAATAAPAVVAEPDEVVDIDSQTVVGRPTSGTIRTRAEQPGTRPIGGRSLPPWATDRRVLASAGGALVLLLGAILFFFRGPDGSTLRVEIDDPDIEVSIKGTDIVFTNADKKPITVTPGEKILHVTRGDFSFDTDTLILKKGETVVVRAEVLDGNLLALHDGKEIGSELLGDGAPIGEAEPPATSRGPGGFALRFESPGEKQSSGRVEVRTLEDPDSSLTMELWVSSPDRGGKRVTPVGNIVGFNGKNRISGSQPGTGLYTFFGSDNFSQKLVVPRDFQGISEDAEVHLAAVRDMEKSECRFYVNGELVGRLEYDSLAIQEFLTFGGIGANNTFEGWMDEARISNVARYDGNFEPRRRFEPDEHTLALYHFDEGHGDVLKDSSGNGHHGKIVGAKWVRVDDAAMRNAKVSGRITGAKLVRVVGNGNPAHDSRVRLVAVSPDGRRVASANDTPDENGEHQLKIWEVASGGMRLTAGVESPVHLNFTPDGRFLVVTGKNGEFRVFDAENNLPEHSLILAPPLESTFALSPDQSSVALFPREAKTAKYELRDLRSGNVRSTPTFAGVEGQDRGVHSAAYAPDGKSIAVGIVGTGRAVQVLDAESGQVERTFPTSKDPSCIAYSFDGTALAWAIGEELQVWNSASDGLTTLDGPNAAQHFTAFDPLGRTVQSFGSDGRLLQWNVATGERMAAIQVPPAGATAGGFDNSGRLLATGHEDGTVAIYEVTRVPPDERRAAEFGLHFDGVDDFVEIASLHLGDRVDDAETPFTIEFRARLEQPFVPGTNHTLVSRHPFNVYFSGGGLNTNLLSGTKEPYTRGAIVGRRATPIHVAAVFDGESLDVFLDGKRSVRPLLVGGKEVSRLRGPLERSPENWRTKTWIGGVWNQMTQRVDRPLHGTIDELRLSDIARYTEDYAPVERLDTDEHTLALYHFDEGQGDVLKDSSGNGHHGKIGGAKWVRVAGGTANPALPGQTRVVELWKVVDPKRDAKIGTWAVDDEAIRLAAAKQQGGRGLLVLPIRPSGSYVLKGRLSVVGNGNPRLHLPVGGRMAYVTPGSTFVALNPYHIGGKAPHLKSRAWSRPDELEIDVKHRPPSKNVEIVVRGDGQEAIRWQGTLDELGSPDEVLLDTDVKAGSGLGFAVIAIQSFAFGSATLTTTVGDPAPGVGTTVITPEDGWVDLLPRLSATNILPRTKDDWAGELEHVGVGVRCSRVWGIRLPVLATARSYELEVVQSRALRDEHWQYVNLPVGGGRVQFNQGGGKPWSLDREPVVNAPDSTTPVANMVQRFGVRVAAGVPVRVNLSIDGMPAIDWKGDPGELSGHYENYLKDLPTQQARDIAVPGTITWCPDYCPTTISVMRLRVLDGEATVASTTPPPAFAPFDAASAKAHQEAWARHLGEPVVTTNSIGMQLAVVPPGKFRMGEGAGAVDVLLTRPSRVGVTEVTNGQWKAVMGTEPWKGQGSTLADETAAATFVNWDDANGFCRRLTEAERGAGKLRAGWEYRLPTEAEWEYACRAGTTTKFSFGDDASLLGEYAWHKGNAELGGEKYAHPVAGKMPNRWGLHDMHGNVWEWTADWQAGLTGGIDPQGPTSGRHRVPRGGCWNAGSKGCTSAFRSYDTPTSRYWCLGFRAVLAPTGEARKVGVAPPSAVAPFDATTAKAHQEAWAKYLGEPVVTTNSIGMQLAVIPPGKFEMGEGDEAVDVSLTKPFRIGAHEVTQAVWKSVMSTEPWRGQRLTREGDGFPATNVNWDDAVEFCRRLTEADRKAGRLTADRGYRLPTEAEWEYACRAGTTTAYSYGDGAGQLGRYGWYGGNAEEDPGGYAHAVGRKEPNPFGLYDAHGNVWEWCSDWSQQALSGGSDPRGATSGSERVLRSGGANLTAGLVRSAHRGKSDPATRNHSIGFRVVLAPTRRTAWMNLLSGNDLAAWDVLGETGWSVENGVLRSGPQTPETGGGALVTKSDYTDYELEFEMRLPQGGIVTPIVDKHGDTWQVNIGTTNPLPMDAEWHRLRVVERDRRLSIELDGQPAGEHSYAGDSSGRVGFRSCDVAVEYRNVRVRALPAPPE